MKAAIYARVSTRDKQDVENQLQQLRGWMDRQGLACVEYVDRVSGGKDERKREQFGRMMQDAQAGRINLVVFWALDRFTREGVLPTLQYLERLNQYGVAWKSFTEQYLDSTGIFKDAVVAIIAAIAKQERIRLSERVRAGVDTARRKGKVLGRPRSVYSGDEIQAMLAAGTIFRTADDILCMPRKDRGPLTIINQDYVLHLHKKGMSLGKIARKLGTSKAKVNRIITLLAAAA